MAGNIPAMRVALDLAGDRRGRLLAFEYDCAGNLTAVQIAAAYGRARAYDFLASEGADVAAKDASGYSARELLEMMPPSE
jgi:hypothetical protein